MAFPAQEPARAAARPTRRASAAFMEMLRGARNPPVVATATWTDVSAQFEADPRCIAIAEPQRAQMFATFKDALAQLEEAKAAKERAAAAENYKVCFFLSSQGPSPLRCVLRMHTQWHHCLDQAGSMLAKPSLQG